MNQLSQWDVLYTHDQYARWAKTTQLLDQWDRELLDQQAQMRKKRGWGQGFEQTFLVDDSIEDAAARVSRRNSCRRRRRIRSATFCSILRRNWNRCCGNARRKSPPFNKSL